uniref:Uncharacterized protein n=1 Tax=Arundo donax TaxID=35708 RepID=A0A0A9GA73_ARUDO
MMIHRVFQSLIYQNWRAFFLQLFQSLMTVQNLIHVENRLDQNQKKFT